MTGLPESATDAPRRVVRSRRTLWLSAFLAFIACLPFALVFTRSGVEPSEPLQLTEADQKSLKDGLRMISPSFSGRTQDGEPYTLRADWALPNGPKPTRVTLNRLSGTLVSKDGREAIVTSKRGIFFPIPERLELKEGVFGRTSDGYTFETPAATINVNTKQLRTEGEIIAKGPRGSIRADMLEALDGDERMVIFSGNVRVVFVPDSSQNNVIKTLPD